ncbi:MAG: DUF6531 domain-containing protein [Candidatus Thiodiazotropha lotti]|nr:DUF6531 domain-containing protein [Candidatus Thiodiazotropha lotti]MCG8002253.1 DUF6531 domain-containing protein [Candidatus Thiodiazotropha lotti]MCG8008803.1 DUF6531 domain-containing protein [Candidatus Thiodiazotropha lotti]MCW4185872.1 DUF6531 domain-containing protein [Candidatus Thiodiazotropha lotti]MCW4196391.1 DUF6531 domain-containing protein [Candidatus Thiodiazotropha lotti]
MNRYSTINRKAAVFFAVAILPALFNMSVLHAAEPMRWKAYPSATNQTFSNKDDALNDIYNIGGDYPYMTEVTSIDYKSKATIINYKIPDAQVYVGPWIYSMNTAHDCGQTEDLDELLDCHLNAAIAHVLGPTVDIDFCPPYLELDKASGAWTDSQTNQISRAINVYNYGYRYFTVTRYTMIEGQGCTVSYGNTNNYRHRVTSCLYPTTFFDSSDNLCKNFKTAKIVGYPYYYLTTKPKICPIEGAPREGNPCSPSTGNKLETEVDYSMADGSLQVKRYYSSQVIGDGFDQLGPQWRHNYANRIDGYREPGYTDFKGLKTPLYESPREACYNGWSTLKDDVYGGLLATATASYRNGACEIRKDGVYVTKLTVHNTMNGTKNAGTNLQIRDINAGNGESYTYRYLSSQWQPLYPNNTVFSETENGWTLTHKNKTVETYDSEGRLHTSTNSSGQTTLFTYNETGYLDTVISPFGARLTYHYDGSGRLVTINTPDGDLGYGYDTEGRLVSVTYPDNRTRQYHYEDSRFPNHLTGITDANGHRYATWAYDDQGRAILSEHAGSAERIEFAYNPDGTTTVTDAAGAERIYHFTVQQGQMKVDHIEGDRCTTCSGGDNQAYTYDSNGFIASKTDWNGNTTTYTRDSQGRELSRTEASGTPQARTITTTWDTTLNKPLTVTDPEQITQYTYDTEGRLLSRQQSPIQ